MAKLTKEEIESGSIIKGTYVEFLDIKQYKILYRIEDLVYIVKIPVTGKVGERELLDKIYEELIITDKRVPADTSGVITPTFDVLTDIKGISVTESN